MFKRIGILIILCAYIHQANAQSIKAMKASEVMKRAQSADTVYVFNFWATWCVPCIEELPEFDVLADKYKTQPVKIIMVSLDFKESYPMKLDMFVQRRRMQQEVVWLNETNPNVFIPKIEDSWQGSIPATLVIRPGKERKFIEGQITAAQVAEMVNVALKKP